MTSTLSEQEPTNRDPKDDTAKTLMMEQAGVAANILHQASTFLGSESIETRTLVFRESFPCIEVNFAVRSDNSDDGLAEPFLKVFLNAETLEILAFDTPILKREPTSGELGHPGLTEQLSKFINLLTGIRLRTAERNQGVPPRRPTTFTYP